MNFATVIGFSAAILTTFSLLPQTIKTLQTKRTQDISLMTYLILTFGIFLWLVYGIIKNDLPIILANMISLILSISVLSLKIKYR